MTADQTVAIAAQNKLQAAAEYMVYRLTIKQINNSISAMNLK